MNASGNELTKGNLCPQKKKTGHQSKMCQGLRKNDKKRRGWSKNKRAKLLGQKGAAGV